MMKLTAAAAALSLMISLGGCTTGEREAETVGEGTIGGAVGEAPAGGVRTTDETFGTRPDRDVDVETRREVDTESPVLRPDAETRSEMGTGVERETEVVPPAATVGERQTNPETGLIPENNTD